MQKFLLPAFLLITMITVGQNNSPFWSSNGNNNTNLSSKIGTTNGISLRFVTNNVERMKIHSSGNIGIGTPSPVNKLHIRQSIPNKAIEWQHETQNDFWTVGIGTNTLNCRFEFNAALRGQISSVDGAFIAGSDLSLKQDIEDLPGMLGKISQLKASSYYYKDSRNSAKHKTLGFIAQDVEKVIPELVYDMDNGLKGLNYSGFAVVAVKAIQEQQEQIDLLQTEIKTLKEILYKLDAGNNLSSSEAWIKQNTPNPVSGGTSIQYSIPDDIRSARILVTNAKGQQIKIYNVSGRGTVYFAVGTLPSGIYQYTLVADAKTINTRKLVIAR